MEKIVKESLASIVELLKRNGFTQMEDLEDRQGYYYYLKSDKCEIYVRGDDTQEITASSYYYEVIHEIDLGPNKTIGSIASDNLNIYWLVGYLTYNNLMKRNYE